MSLGTGSIAVLKKLWPECDSGYNLMYLHKLTTNKTHRMLFYD